MLHETVLDAAALNLLKEYCQQPFLQKFSLAGGTALALRLGHRISYDLDMFSTDVFSVSDLHGELESFYGKDYFKHGQLSNALFTSIRGIKSDFIYDYGKQIKPFQAFKNIRLYSIEDNIAMKLMAITGRGKKRDFYDLYFILQSFLLEEIFHFFTLKFGEEKLIIVLKSITYFEDAEADSEPVLTGKKVSWQTVKAEIKNRAKQFKF